MFFLAFLIILVLLLVIISGLKLSFMVLASVDAKGLHLEVRVMFYRLLTLFKWNLEEGGLSFLLKKKKDVPEDQKTKKGRVSSILNMIFSEDTRQHLKKRMQIFDVSVKGWLATRDVAATALLYGGIWGILGTMIPFIPQKRLILDFYPDFKKETSDFHVSCILRVRIIHIIVLIVENIRKKMRKNRGENYGTASY